MKFAAIVIGRNEGQRLIHCMESLANLVNVVYVDSGSTDGSVIAARSLGATVVDLDMRQPFTAARARNAGVKKLLEIHPETLFIQFVDGDCQIVSDWIETASQFLLEHPHCAAVFGRRRERYPTATIYNQLCDIEWDTPIGEAKACGGDALIRVSAVTAVDGYRDSMIAGEEPEMCFRMRQLGWKIMRLDAEMTLHDAAMTRFSQWWKRNKRAGHAYAESYDLHGASPEKFKKAECRSILFWAAFLPLMILLLSLWQPLFLLGFLIYPLQFARLAWRYQQRFNTLWLALLYAASNVVGKWPQFQGVAEYHINKNRGQRSKIIEYK